MVPVSGSIRRSASLTGFTICSSLALGTWETTSRSGRAGVPTAASVGVRVRSDRLVCSGDDRRGCLLPPVLAAKVVFRLITGIGNRAEGGGRGAVAVAGGKVSENVPAVAGARPTGFTPGSRIAGYMLEEQIGAGGMALVFRARDERLQRRVALKILSPALAPDDAFRQRFIRESRAAAAVDDPHIIPVFEAGEADGVLFIAMRYVPGGDVRTLMRRAKPLAPERALAIISPVASALDAAHSAGLAHRDVKPENMLIDARPGRPDHVYLSDFGLSKGMMASLGPTGDGSVARNGGLLGARADGGQAGRRAGGPVFAGVRGVRAASAERCHSRAVKHVTAVIWAHMSEPPPTLTSRGPAFPAGADGVLARALAKSPGDRFPSCRDFADALRAAFSPRAVQLRVRACCLGPVLADLATGVGRAVADRDIPVSGLVSNA